MVMGFSCVISCSSKIHAYRNILDYTRHPMMMMNTADHGSLSQSIEVILTGKRRT